MAHDAKDDGLCLLHVHVVDAVADDATDVDGLQDAGQPRVDDVDVGVDDDGAQLLKLLVVILQQFAYGPVEQVLRFVCDEIADDFFGVIADDAVDVLGQQTLGRLCQQLGEMAGTGRKPQQTVLHLADGMAYGCMGQSVSNLGIGQTTVDELRQLMTCILLYGIDVVRRQIVVQESAQRLGFLFLPIYEPIIAAADFFQHVGRQQTAFQHLSVHEIFADGGTYGFGYAAWFLGNDARRERNTQAEDVLWLMRTEHHSDGNVVGDIADDAAQQGSE